MTFNIMMKIKSLAKKSRKSVKEKLVIENIKRRNKEGIQQTPKFMEQMRSELKKYQEYEKDREHTKT